MQDASTIEWIREKYRGVQALLNERSRRCWAAAEARSLGWGGVTAVISVDTKKKERVGPFKNNGREWRPAGTPEQVLTHDFPDPKMKKTVPYGVYDLGRNEGWVSVGIDRDTARLAAATIKRWWMKMGKRRYPKAKELLITADCGGSEQQPHAPVESRVAGIGR